MIEKEELVKLILESQNSISASKLADEILDRLKNEQLKKSQSIDYRTVDIPSDEMLDKGYMLFSNSEILRGLNYTGSLSNCYLQGNWFASKEEAELERDWRKLNCEILHTIKKLNKEDGFVVDWEDDEQSKYYIDSYSYESKEILVDNYCYFQDKPNSHYMSEESANKLLTIYKTEELKFWITKER